MEKRRATYRKKEEWKWKDRERKKNTSYGEREREIDEGRGTRKEGEKYIGRKQEDRMWREGEIWRN